MKYLLLLILALVVSSSVKADYLFDDKNYYCFTKDLTATFNPDAVPSTGLTAEQARKLLAIVLQHQKYRLNSPDLFIEGPLINDKNKPLVPGSYSFSLGDASTNVGAITYLGLYAVNRGTGDVWEINQCKNYIFPELGQAQASIMLKTGKSKENEKLVRLRLGCPMGKY